nr:cytochrome ubiquinol oxidase subunit I [Desulfuromonadales bacterium]
ESQRVEIGDPWDGRTLEWSIPAPPPEYNYAIVPKVEARDAFAFEKERGTAYDAGGSHYQDIVVPKNTSIGMTLCVLSGVWAFALVWWIWWLAALTTLAMVAAVILRSFVTETERIIPAEQVKEEHQAWLRKVEGAAPVDRDFEASPKNLGYAAPDLV